MQGNFKQAIMQKSDSSPVRPGELTTEPPCAETLSTALEAAEAGFWEWHIQSGALQIDRNWAAVTGHTIEELAPMNMEQWKAQLHPDDRERAIRKLTEHAAGKAGFCELSIRVRHSNGNWTSVLDRGKILRRTPEGKPLSIVGSRKAIKPLVAPCTQPLEGCAKELRSLIENIPGTIYRIDAAGATTLLSSPPPFLDASADQQHETRLFDPFSIVHPDDRQMVAETDARLKASPHSVKITYRILTPHNTTRWIEDQKTSTFSDDGAFRNIDGILFDITDRIASLEQTRRLELQVRKSQRLETIGTLAGGIAHDFNNILTPILGYAEMGLDCMDQQEPLYEYFTEIMQAAERAQKLVSQILTFSRAQDGKPSPVLIRTIIAEALQLLRPSLPATISIEQHIESAPRRVLADPSQMHQLIINLCTNAFHAMEHDGGILSISLKEIQPKSDQTASSLHLPEQSYLKLTVSDTGSGMDETTIERMFEPFFTTKSVEKGAGLGLSVVHGIVTRAGGQVTAESRKGQGSAFHVYLPIIDETATPEPPQKPLLSKSGAKILFVDDEPSAVQMMSIMMKKLGFTIHAEQSPLAALKRFRDSPEQYDLVITDLTMPEMTGLQLAGELHKLAPLLPIILMTGYGQIIDHDRPLKQCGINRLLKKPVKLIQLATTVNEVLKETNLCKTQ